MSKENNRVVCLRGKKVVLRPLDISTDFEFFMKWINDRETIKHLLRIAPVYPHQQLAWFQSLPNSTDIIFTIETVEGVIIGMIGLERIDLINGTAWSWQIIGEKQYRNLGLGSEAKILLLDYAFNALRLEKVAAEIIAANEISLRYNEKMGYREEGRLRNQIFREGKRSDLVLLGIMKEEFEEIHRRYLAKAAAA